MESFTTRFQALVSTDEKEWYTLDVMADHQCRDSAIYWMHCRTEDDLNVELEGNENFKIKDVSVSFLPKSRISPDYSIFKELAEVFQVNMEIVKKISDFTGRELSWIKFSGNDNTSLMAWYWAILAMRSGIVNETGTFFKRMYNSSSEDDYTWDNYGDRENSLTVWKAWVEGRKGPTNRMMVIDAICPIDWFFSQ